MLIMRRRETVIEEKFSDDADAKQNSE